jgi:phosphoketolase
MHMPLPGERLVTFLSDGAFEEQRGSDWAPRWWRAEDTGYVLPIMINNGRRIDQRSTMAQQGGSDWLVRHLQLNSFDPFVFDGKDPAAFAWAIFEMENRLDAATQALRAQEERYPIKLPYGIATAPKGAGFPGAGTNLALMANPSADPSAAHQFNEGARRLWVPLNDLKGTIGKFQGHGNSGRVRERDHALVHRQVQLRETPPLVSSSSG